MYGIAVLCWMGGEPLVAYTLHFNNLDMLGTCEADFSGFVAQALQKAVERLSTYLGTLEEKMEALEKKKK